MHIEKKVDQLVQELAVAKDELLDQRAKTSELKKQLVASEEQTNQYKTKYLKQKQNTKNLENEHKYVCLQCECRWRRR